jgi:uncharacterized protein (TIGR02246 family)
VNSRIFATAQDAENAFYDALGRADLEAMMEVWAEDEEIVCVHPAGPRLAGQEQVRASWTKMFANAPPMRVHVTQQVKVAGSLVAVHSVHENFLVEGEPEPQGPVAATNVYLRTPAGWRMIAHHASPVPGKPEMAPAPHPPKTLH